MTMKSHNSHFGARIGKSKMWNRIWNTLSLPQMYYVAIFINYTCTGGKVIDFLTLGCNPHHDMGWTRIESGLATKCLCVNSSWSWWLQIAGLLPKCHNNFESSVRGAITPFIVPYSRNCFKQSIESMDPGQAQSQVRIPIKAHHHWTLHSLSVHAFFA